MLSFILSAVLTALAGFARDYLAGLNRDRLIREKGVADATLQTDKVIEGVADVQRKNDAVDRGGASDVARRLRDRLRAGNN